MAGEVPGVGSPRGAPGLDPGTRRPRREAVGPASSAARVAGARERVDRRREHGGLLRWSRRPIVNSPGWPEIKSTFFNGRVLRESFPEIVRAVRDQRLHLHGRRGARADRGPGPRRDAEPAGPGLRPAPDPRDRLHRPFRGIPTILVISLLGFGVPALRLRGLPTDEVFWAIVALVLVYSAYVAEVYRAGIESVHPSQTAAARSLGLSRMAVDAPRRAAAGRAPRRPPAAERLHRPAEGLGARRVHRRGRGAADGEHHLVLGVQLHAVRLARARVPRDHDPADAVRRLADRTRSAPAAGRAVL